MQRKLWEITSHMLLKASWACWQRQEHLLRAGGTVPEPCPLVTSGNCAMTQHIWSGLPQNRWESSGLPLPRSRSTVTGSIRGPAVGGVQGRFGKQQQASSAGALRSWKFSSRVSRETQRLLLMQRNSPGSLPFSHNKHTAKSLAGCFDEATCISPFSVYRKLLLKKVILVFTDPLKGQAASLPLSAGGSLREERSQLAEGRFQGALAGQVGVKDSGVNTKAGTPTECLPPEISSVSPLERHFLLIEVDPWCRLLLLQGLTFA